MLDKEAVRLAVGDLRAAGKKVSVNSVQAITGGNRAKVADYLKEVREDEVATPKEDKDEALLMDLLRKKVDPDNMEMSETETLTKALLMAYEKHREYEDRIEKLEAYTVTWRDAQTLVVTMNKQEVHKIDDRYIDRPCAKLVVHLEKAEHALRTASWKGWCHTDDITLDVQAIRDLKHLVSSIRDLPHQATILEAIAKVHPNMA